MAFYISLNDATKQLYQELKEINFYEQFLDKITVSNCKYTHPDVSRHKYIQQVLIEYIKSSYIIIYGIRCLKGEKLYNKPEVMPHEFFPLGWTHKYKWKIDYLCKHNSAEPCHDSWELDLNLILSFSNDLLYSDVSIKRKDFDFLKNNLMTHFKELFPKEVDKVKKFSIIGFIKSVFTQESKKK